MFEYPVQVTKWRDVVRPRGSLTLEGSPSSIHHPPLPVSGIRDDSKSLQPPFVFGGETLSSVMSGRAKSQRRHIPQLLRDLVMKNLVIALLKEPERQPWFRKTDKQKLRRRMSKQKTLLS